MEVRRSEGVKGEMKTEMLFILASTNAETGSFTAHIQDREEDRCSWTTTCSLPLSHTHTHARTELGG